MGKEVILVYCEMASPEEFSILSVFPIGLFSISAFLNENGYNSGVWSGKSSQWEEFLGVLKREKPQIIGFYIAYDNFYLVKDWCRILKKDMPELLLVAGGPQTVVFDKEDFEESLVDIAVIGEGEVTMLEICQWFLDGYGRLSDIKGIRYLEDGKVKETSPRPIIQNLSALPFPRSEDALYPCKLHVYPVISGRGCPFSCTFCYEGAIKPKRYRFRSVRHLADELEYAFSRHPIRYLVFVDDTFSLNRKRLRQITDVIKNLRSCYDFIWFCEAHVRSVLAYKEEFLDMLSAGLHRVQIGIESGDNKVLSYYKKKTTKELIEQAVNFLTSTQVGFCNVNGNFILGGPFETKSSLSASMELAERLLKMAPGKIDIQPIFLAFYPGTPITLSPEKFGLNPLKKDLKGKFIWLSMAEPVAITDDLSLEDLVKAYNEIRSLIHNTIKALLDSIKRTNLYLLFYRYFHYKAHSVWIDFIKRYRPQIWLYFWHLFEGKFESILHSKVNSEEVLQMKPYKIFSSPRLKEYSVYLSNEELLIFNYATGKLTVEEIAKFICFDKEKVVKILAELERNFCIVFLKN